MTVPIKPAGHSKGAHSSVARSRPQRREDAVQGILAVEELQVARLQWRRHDTVQIIVEDSIDPINILVGLGTQPRIEFKGAGSMRLAA